MHRLVPVALSLLVVLAGCNALAPQQSSNNGSDASPTATSTGETVTPTATPTPTTTPPPAATATSPTAATPPTTAIPSTTLTSTVTPGRDGTSTASENLPSAATVKTQAMAAIDAVDTYRVSVNRTVRLSGNLNRTVVRTTNGTFDRDAREAHVTTSQSVLGRTLTSERYFVDGTLYVRSQRYVSQYGSAWITGVSDSIWSFSLFDRLFRHRALLSVSTVTLAGTERINGTTTYRLKATPDASKLERGVSLLRQRTSLNVTNVSATYWIDTETMRPVRAVFELSGEMTIRDRPVGIDQRIRLRFDDYGDSVSITLPPAADTAVSISGNATTSTDTATQTTTVSG